MMDQPVQAAPPDTAAPLQRLGMTVEGMNCASCVGRYPRPIAEDIAFAAVSG